MSTAKYAVIQMSSGQDITQNLNRASILIESAASNGAEFVLLPEAFAVFGQRDQAKIAQYESNPIGPIRHFLSQHAKKFGIYLQGGTIPCAQDNRHGQSTKKAFASSFMFGPDGEELGRYDKLHLFDAAVADQQGAYTESMTFDAGDRPTIVDLPFARLGMSVCYDLRFPELYRYYAERDVGLITVPSAFTKVTGEAHWLVLLRARAIENACFILAANQCGDHGEGRLTYGHSCIIDPWGRVIAEAGEEEAVLMAEFEVTSAVAATREAIPVLDNRRFQSPQLKP